MKGILRIRLVVLGLLLSTLFAACGDQVATPTNVVTTTTAPTMVVTIAAPVSSTTVVVTPFTTTLAPTTTVETIIRLVDVGGYKLFINCTGQGSPTVILDAGLGTSSTNWRAVQSSVSKSTRVCSYDRANVGQSDKTTVPRTSQQIVKELKALLTNAQIKGPYILVGHSFGGLNMQLYASQYPNEGAVLVEASHREQTIRFDKILTKEQTAILYDFTGNPEKVTFENFQESMAQVRAGIKFPPVPLIVLTKGLLTPKPSNWSASLGDPFSEYDKAWNEMQAEMVTLSPKGKQLIAEKSDHFIPDKQPAIIVQSIQEIINQV